MKHSMKCNELTRLRKLAEMTQAQFAKTMGMPRRTYENLEREVVPLRQVHIDAACWATMKATGLSHVTISRVAKGEL